MLAVRKAMMGGMKLPEVVSTTSGVSGGMGSTISFTGITGAIGQLQVVILGTSDNRTVTPPAGWTEFLDDGGFSLGSSLAAFYRDVVADDTASQVFTFSGSSSDRTYLTMRLKNARFGIMGTKGTLATGTTQPTAPSITTDKSGLLFCLAELNSEGSAWSAPPGMTITKTEETGMVGLGLFQQKIAVGVTGTRSPTNPVNSNKNAVLFSVKGK